MKNLLRLTGLLLFTGIIMSCFEKPDLEAHIKGLGNDSIFLEYQTLSDFYEERARRDTIYSHNNLFYYNNPYNEPIIIFIYPKRGMRGPRKVSISKYMIVLLKPGNNINIQGELKDFCLDYDAKGSEFNEEFSQVRKSYLDKLIRHYQLALQRDSVKANNGDKELSNKLWREKRDIRNQIEAVQLKYIKNNWDKRLSAFLLSRQPLDTFGKYYEKLKPVVKNGIFKNVLDKRLTKFKKHEKVKEAKKKVTKGEKAPDFSLETIKGNEFTLSSLDEKYVVLDFWGSWCSWCIKGFPKMKSYYKKYKEEVEFVGIACKDTKKEWKSAVKKHDLNWIQVYNNSELSSNVSVKYGIEGYPTKFILDKNKKIIGKFVGESKEFYDKLDKIMKKNKAANML